MLMEFKSTNEALETAAAGALDTVIGNQVIASGTAFLLNRGNRGIKNANWSTPTLVHAGLWMEFSVELDAVTAIDIVTTPTENVWLLGLEFDYMPMFTRAPHSERDGPLDDSFR